MKKKLGYSIFLGITMLLLISLSNYTDILDTSKWVARILFVISLVNFIYVLKLFRESKK